MAILNIEHIVSDPTIKNGKPFVAKAEITVQHIARLHNDGWSVDSFIREYKLTPGQIYAALSYYYDHQTEIDQAIQAEREYAKQLVEKGRALAKALKRHEKRKAGQKK
ncbi:MAG: DUF433 domain-containing protein [Anaerolineae bacterium]|nr:DUF433 domain-containing protein [Anaerolineae bacterium]